MKYSDISYFLNMQKIVKNTEISFYSGCEKTVIEANWLKKPSSGQKRFYTAKWIPDMTVVPVITKYNKIFFTW